MIKNPVYYHDTIHVNCLRDTIEDLKHEYMARDADGFEWAYIQGLEHVLEEEGDGGITGNYFRGLKDGLRILQEGDVAVTEIFDD